MAYIFTLQQQETIEALKLAVETDSNRNYSEVYQYIADILFHREEMLSGSGNHVVYGPSLADQDPAIREVALWFAGAAQVNAGEGAFSVLIREYTDYQLQLRNPNWTTLSSEQQKSLMQAASNRVAENALEDLINNRNWELPTLDSIAKEDAVGTGEILFDYLDVTDSAHSKAQNSAWSGALLFSMLDATDTPSSEQSWRLLGTESDSQLDTLADFRDVIFAYTSFIYAFNKMSVAGSIFDGSDDISIGLQTYIADPFFAGPTAESVLDNMTNGDAADSAIDFIRYHGPEFLLSKLAALMGVEFTASTSPESLAQQAQFLFTHITSNDQLSLSFKRLEGSEDFAVLAQQNNEEGQAYRYALVNLLPFVVTGNSSLYSQHNQNGELDLESFAAEYLDDRAQMLEGYLAIKKAGTNFVPTNSDISWANDSILFHDLDTGIYFSTWSARSDFSPSLSYPSEGSGVQRKIFGSKENSNILTGAEKDDHLYGGTVDDTLIGKEGADKLYGGDGIDRLFSSDELNVDDNAVDVLAGGKGDDIYYMAGGDIAKDTEGNDVYIINSESANGQRIVIEDTNNVGSIILNNERVTYAVSKSNSDNSWLFSTNTLSLLGTSLIITDSYGNEVEIKNFSSGDLGITLDIEIDNTPEDIIIENTYTGDNSSPTADYIRASDNNDKVVSGDLNDTVLSLQGDDIVEAGDGNDFVDGFTGDDQLYGEAGNDHIFGGLGKDTIYGGVGNDRIILDLNDGHRGSGEEFADGGEGDDWISGGAGKDVIYGGTGDNNLFGGSGADIIKAGDGDDVISGDGYAILSSGEGKISGRLQTDYTDLTDNYNDQIDAGDGNNEVFGGAGADVITTGAGNDAIHADKEDASLYGGTYSVDFATLAEVLHGNDTINSGAGNDEILAGGGNDFVNAGDGDDTVWGDDFAEVTSGGNDIIYAGSGRDLVYGGKKSDHIYGGSGNDSLYGNEGSDFIYAGTENDVVHGNEGSDFLYGEAGDDTLEGHDGNDLLVGGRGVDHLNGGAGRDTYRFERGDAVVINDISDNIIDTAGEGNKIIFGAGIDVNDINIKVFGNDLYLTYFDEGLLISDGFKGVIDSYLFDSSGITFSYRELFSKRHTDFFSISGTSEADDLFGGAGSSLLRGGDGNDTLSSGHGQGELLGEGGDDLLVGNIADDSLHGGMGNDFLKGGDGNDTLNGGEGSDVYFFDSGFGHDVINNDDMTDSIDVILFGKNILPDAVVASRVNDDLRLQVDDDSITVLGFFSASMQNNQVINEVRFSNGVIWSTAQIGAMILQGSEADDTLNGYFGDDHLSGSGGNDSLKGFAGNDVLEGGAGSDNLSGGEGSDSYHFSLGFGHDVINNEDSLSDSVDRIVFDESIAPSDVSLSRANNDLVIKVATDQINVTNFFLSSMRSDYLLDEIQFSDGTRWGSQDIAQIVLTPTDNNDELHGYDTNDVIAGAAGDDDIYGHEGNDTLRGDAGADVLYGGAGQDSLEGGEDNDTLYGGADADQLYGNEGDDRLEGDSGNDELDGGEGRDHLVGGDGDDTLRGGLGNDILAGGTGNNTFFYAKGDGRDSIFNAHEGQSTLILSGIALSEVQIRRSSTSMVLSFLGSPGDQIDLRNMFSGLSNTTYMPQSGLSISLDNQPPIYFSPEVLADLMVKGSVNDDDIDGTSLSDHAEGFAGNDVISTGDGDDILDGGTGNDSLSGGDGNDHLIGANGEDRLYGGNDDDRLDGGDGNDGLVGDRGNDSLNGGGGDDLLSGGRGDDQYYIAASDGNDQIDDDSGLDQLIFSDVLPTDLLLRRDGFNLVVRNTASGSVINISEQFTDIAGQPGAKAIESFVFSDNTVWSFDDIAVAATAGTSANDVIHAHATSDIIDAGDGNDEVFSGGGDDTVRGGKGNDTLHGESGNDKLYGGDNNDILIAGDGDDYLQGDGGKDELQGGDGNDTLKGNGGSDKLYGGSGDDKLYGGGGNDELYAQWGDDKLYGGNGHDILNGNLGGVDQRLFGQEGNDTLVGQGKLYGGNGDDVIQGIGLLSGDAGNDTLTVRQDYTNGNNINSLFGGDGDDTLIASEQTWGNVSVELTGGKGNDLLFGSYADDTYYFNLGDGSDRIIETRNGGSYSNITPSNDRLIFGAGITSTMLSAERQSNDLLLKVGDSDDSILIERWFQESTDHFKLNQFVFDDGTVLTDADIENIAVTIGTAMGDSLLGYRQLDEVIQAGEGDDQVWGRAGNDQLYGDDGNDILDGGDGNDSLDGGAGNDQLKGGLGDDVYITGSGNDTIVIDANGGHDTIDVKAGGSNGIIFGAGLTADRLDFSQEGDDLLIKVDDGSTQTIRVTDHFLGGEAAIDWLRPSGSNALTASQINQLIIDAANGNEGNEGSGDEGSGNGTTGNFDTVVVGSTAGEQLLGTNGTNLIQGLDGNDQIFGFAGNDQLEGGSGDDRLYGGNGSRTNSGDDVLIGGEGNDILVGEDGNDRLEGGAGNDHYYYYAGTGKDEIIDAEDGQDILFFNDVAPDRLSYHQDGSDLIVLVDGDLEQQVRVKDHFLGGNHEIMVQPNGGYTQTAAAIANQLTALPGTDNSSGEDPDTGSGTDTGNGDTGTDGGDGNSQPGDTSQPAEPGTDLSGDDTVTGTANAEVLVSGSGNDTLSGLAGNDRLIGGTGDDVYIIGAANGLDTVIDSEGQNIIRFVDGIGFNDVASGLVKSGNDLILRISGSATNQVRIANFFTVANTIEKLEFEVGGQITAAQLYGAFGSAAPTATLTSGELMFGDGQANTLTGDTANDMLFGGRGDDTLQGNAGDDQLFGGAGDDVYLIGASHGKDTIIDTEGTNIIRFIDGIGFNDVASGLMKSGNDLILRVGSGGDQVKIESFFSVANTINKLEFETGGQITAAQLYGVFGAAAPTATTITYDALTGVITGTAGNDTLNGSDGNDQLSGNAGNDTLDGGAGDDRYLFGKDDGQDVIAQNDADGNDTLVFDGNIATDELWFSRQGEDLQINIAGTDDQVTVDNWYTNDGAQLDEIEVGSSVLRNSQVNQLVNAMAAYSVPEGDGGVIAQSTKDALQPVLTQVWETR
ncbi:calcium-binding protein [Aliamphritea hakodatensis]|uniref:calcium-binding protein n=1 Tax=Aliamphritea hakodatensis TaxID=2895352 RepID=UPI0022FDA334|nr:calcium-binding protein [Aliamphritea hakodatensis]